MSNEFLDILPKLGTSFNQWQPCNVFIHSLELAVKVI